MKPAGYRLVGTALALLGLLAACGFQPLYGSKSGTILAPDSPLNRVNIALIEDREGQILRNYLIDRFQPDGSGRYVLVTSLTVVEEDLGVAEDSTTTRSRIVVNAGFSLTYGENTHEFTARSAGSFSTVQSDYGTLVARQNATERSLRDIADEAKVRIGAFLRRLEGG